MMARRICRVDLATQPRYAAKRRRREINRSERNGRCINRRRRYRPLYAPRRNSDAALETRGLELGKLRRRRQIRASAAANAVFTRRMWNIKGRR